MNAVLPAVADWGTSGTPFRLEGREPVLYVPGQGRVADELWKLAAGEDLGYYGWLRAVDRLITARTGLDLLSLPDREWREDYEGRVDPAEAVDVALDEYEGEYGVAAL